MKVLVIAPHPDDEVLGVGGTIAKRAASGDKVRVFVVTKGYPPMFLKKYIDAGRREAMKANHVLGAGCVVFSSLPAASLDSVPHSQIIKVIHDEVCHFKPDEVYIPHHGDIHIDHKAIADAAMVALRPKYNYAPKRIYAYEVPSETGWDAPHPHNAFVPNVYEDISFTLLKKLKALKIYRSQAEAFPMARSIEAVNALAVYRGTTVCTEAAEAFMLIREVK